MSQSSLLRLPRLPWLLDRPSHWQSLDPLAVRIKSVVDRVLPPGPVADLLHGKPIGHPAHPPLAEAALGGWSAAALLAGRELLGWGDGPADRSTRHLLGWAGLASAVPTILSGWKDWSELHEDQQRTGLVHAATMASGAALSLAARGTRRRSRLSSGLDLAAAVVVTGGAALGGHLAFRWAAGPNHAEAFPHLAKEGWSRVCRVDELIDGQPRFGTAGDEQVVVCRLGQDIYALADRCSHLGGPLHEGEVQAVGGVDCLVCPWHQSAFRLEDGAAMGGPAYAPQPALDVRTAYGWVDVRPRPLPGVAGR
jgi:nitrite reductase/ring-hydroxylating ferredoxin subunit